MLGGMNTTSSLILPYCILKRCLNTGSSINHSKDSVREESPGDRNPTNALFDVLKTDIDLGFTRMFNHLRQLYSFDCSIIQIIVKYNTKV
jgi:hypothetical protein